MEQKNLQTIQKEKIEPIKEQIAQQNIQVLANDKYPSNYITNVIKSIKDAKSLERVWFDFSLPSNGMCGYSKDIKIRELTTEDERIFLKEIFADKETSVLNLIKKCVKFEGNETFNFEKLTTFDQDFILLELSAITFPGEKDIIVTDENKHKINMKLNKEELVLNKVEENTIYPFKIELPESKLIWYLEFMTIEKTKEIDKTNNLMQNDLLLNMFNSISYCTVKVQRNLEEILIDTNRDYIQLLRAIDLDDLKILLTVYNDITTSKYGYKLSKEFFCEKCDKINKVELDPLNFFRLTI